MWPVAGQPGLLPLGVETEKLTAKDSGLIVVVNRSDELKSRVRSN